jgi:hypothetical protein
MHGDIAIEMMPPDFLLWRCLHGGPLDRKDLEAPGPDPSIDWAALRARNVRLLESLTEVYGACAVTAREGDRIVGALRFYPKEVWRMAGSTGFCLQQSFPSGPGQDFGKSIFRPLEDLEDRTLSIHCITSGRPGVPDDPHRRRGLGSRMVRALIDWARPRGWRVIEATAFTDLDILYAVSGSAGRAFWEKLGFRVVSTDVEPELQKESEFVDAMRREAAVRGIPADRLADKFTMRLDLCERPPPRVPHLRS